MTDGGIAMYAVLLLASGWWFQAPPPIPETDLTPELPQLSEAHEFGYTQPFAQEQWVKHCRHTEWLEKARHYYIFIPREQWDAWMMEAIWRRNAWDMLDDGLGPQRLGKEEARRRIQRLRIILGERLYQRRQMPEPYPEMMYPVLD
jgi:hypothetical protein